MACFTAIVLTLLILVFTGVSLFKTAAEPDKPEVKSKTVLLIDLSKPVMEQRMDAGINLPEGKTPEVLGLFDMVRAIKQAASDSLIKGMYLKCEGNSSGFANSNELRNQLIEFKKSGKFIIAASDYISQRAYEVANVADHIYCQPNGMVDWKGYALQLTFFKGTMDKLEIEPEIFYAGQYKSATEPYRLTKMSEPNRVQLTSFLEDLYQRFLVNTSKTRKVDTATLRGLANNFSVRSASAANAARLTDDLKYDDEVKDEIRKKIHISLDEKINFMPIGDYIKNGRWNDNADGENIALIYAQGEIIDGNGQDNEIGGERYRDLIRKARMDKKIKAVVLRVNSPGGSSIASENIWREVMLCKKEKPVVVSIGDYGASGGYYISCFADSIFAQPNTLTGSIGVFSMYFNAQQLFNNKFGITFDGVKTAEHADFGTASRPMTDVEKKVGQEGVDSIYLLFKQRVADGRKLPLSFVDSIAQGRIWSGERALQLKLIDRIGGLQDAVDCAARMAKIKSYRLKEWPEVESFWKKLFGEKDDSKNNMQAYALKEQLGAEEYDLISQFKTVKSWAGIPQMRLPFFASFK